MGNIDRSGGALYHFLLETSCYLMLLQCQITRESGRPFDWPEDMNLPSFSFLTPVSLRKGIMFPSTPWNIRVLSDYFCNQQVWHYTQCISFYNHYKKPSARIVMFSMYNSRRYMIVHCIPQMIPKILNSQSLIIHISLKRLVCDTRRLLCKICIHSFASQVHTLHLNTCRFTRTAPGTSTIGLLNLKRYHNILKMIPVLKAVSIGMIINRYMIYI